jgi:ribosome-associated protein
MYRDLRQCPRPAVISKLHVSERAAGRGGAVVSLEVTVRGIVIPPTELSWRFSRSPGPGGQSVNTTDSQAELSFDIGASATLPPMLKQRALTALRGRLADGVVTVTASEFRSQLRNREAAAARLSELLTEATAPPPPARRPTKPTRASTERRLASKQRRSQLKRLRRGDDHT